MTQNTHYFFAVKIPDQTKEIMKEHLESLKLTLPFSRWVHHQDLHITLAFLGHAPEEKLEKAKENMMDVVKSEQPFSLKINKLGIFGSQGAPRIFWADIADSQALKCIQKKVYQACVDAGFTLEKRPFRPHITLARRWEGADSFRNGQLDVWAQIQPEPLEFQTTEIVLYQTHLNQTPKYQVKNVYKLE